MNMSKASMKKYLGILIVFALPLLFTGYTISKDIANRHTTTDSRTLINDSSLVSTDRETQTTVFSEPVISIVFDDGWESVYTEAFPIMESMGINSTQFIITSTFDNSRYMSVEQIKHMMRNGHEIQSHTVSHPDLSQLTGEQLKNELYDSFVRIEGITEVAVEDLAVPLGAYNDETIEVAQKWYRSIRTTHPGIDTEANFNPFELFSPSLRATSTLEDIEKYIQEAKAQNGWLILTYHQIDTSGDTYAVTPDAFRAHMQAVVNSGIDIVPYSRTLNLLKEQQQ